MKKLLSLAITLFIGTLTHAQTSGQIATYTPGVGAITDGLYNYAMGDVAGKKDKLSYEDTTIEGSPYLFNSFMPAQLYDGNKLVGNIYYRYNAYNEEIEIKLTNSTDEPIRGLGKDKKIRVVVAGKSLSFKTFIDQAGNTKNGYMTLLKDGDYKLYRHLSVNFKEAKKAENSFVKSEPSKFTQSTEYYIELKGEKIIKELELNKKKLVALVNGTKQNSLQDFIKENNIKIKDESDLLKVFEFLNN